MEAIYKERPPSSDPEGRKAWAQRYETLMKERPQPDPAPPPQKAKHNHD
jgi:hypothetical protein